MLYIRGSIAIKFFSMAWFCLFFMALDSDIHHISLTIYLKFWLVFHVLEKHLFQQLSNCKIFKNQRWLKSVLLFSSDSW